MRRIVTILLALAGLLLGAFTPAQASEETHGGRVNNLKVLSDSIDDVTTLENILKSFVKPGMSDAERSQALWTAAVRYRHQSPPPNEFLAADWEAHDPVKIFNVYGYCMCCCSSALIAALNRADGRAVRGRILNGHSVPEVRYGGDWHMFDASLITVFPKPNGRAASVDEIAAAVRDWYASHPGYRKDSAKLLDLMRSDGWTGWKSKGPPLLAACPYYSLGYFPARTHGWDATMVEYDRKCEVYEYGYQVGHRALFSLRPGESFVREAGNHGLHVNRDQMPGWDALNAKAPENDLVYVNQFLPGYRGGVVGNGTHRYAPDLSSDSLALGSEVFDNLACGGSPALHTKEAGRPGVAIIPMISPYVYLGGTLRLKMVGRSPGDRVAVSISTNNGRTFAPLVSGTTDQALAAKVDLKDKIARRYAYWLKIEIVSTTPGTAGLNELVVENDIQHAPRTLPWLKPGRNTITVDADRDPSIATRTVAFRITSDASFTKNETSGTLGVNFDNLRVEDGSCWWTGGVGTMTVPVGVPGDLVALRWSAQVRARGAKDLIRMLVSTDEGRTWREAARIAGPTPGTTRQFRADDWPAGTRKALLRFELTGNNTVGLFSVRVDADYRDPIAARTFRSFRVVHRWREGGQAKSHAMTVDRFPFRDTIEAGSEPEMVSVSYEMPQMR